MLRMNQKQDTVKIYNNKPLHRQKSHIGLVSKVKTAGALTSSNGKCLKPKRFAFPGKK